MPRWVSTRSGVEIDSMVPGEICAVRCKGSLRSREEAALSTMCLRCGGPPPDLGHRRVFEGAGVFEADGLAEASDGLLRLPR